MEQKDKLKNYIEGLFEKKPQSTAVWELKEEILTNSLERYSDLIAKGMSEEEAYRVVCEGIGEVDELVKAVYFEDQSPYTAAMQQERKKSALLFSIAVGLYIFAGIVLLIGLYIMGNWFLQRAVVALSLLLCIPPTIMMVYSAKTRPVYEKKSDSVVENFKEWNSSSGKMKSIRRAISGIIWSVTVIVYFFVSFMTMMWYITWLILLIGLCVEAVTSLVFYIKELK